MSRQTLYISDMIKQILEVKVTLPFTMFMLFLLFIGSSFAEPSTPLSISFHSEDSGESNTNIIRNSRPEVTNVNASQRRDGSKIVDIYYDLFDAEGEACNISFKFCVDVGEIDEYVFDIIPNPVNVSGDYGEAQNPDLNKHIVWNAGAEGFTLNGGYACRVYADDGYIIQVPDNFAFVGGGTFNNGSSSVTISDFYIDKYEITQTGYQAVMGINPAEFTGVTNGPVERVSWHKAIEYCNRRSIQEGITPCYSYSTYGTNPDNWPANWFISNANHTNISCNWNAIGYRLPTEMEWMFAARGGNLTHNYTYSGSNTVSNVAWYNSNSSNTTHTVATKVANELGTYDMSGNVFEWVWDIWADYPTEAQTDPHGAVSGSYRVARGGSWMCPDSYATVAYRGHYYAGGAGSHDIGFRCVRIPPTSGN